MVAVAEVSRPSERVEVLPVPAGPGNPTVVPRRYEVERLPGDLRELTTAYAALDALRDAVANPTRRAGRTPPPRRGTRSRSCGSSARPSATASPACG